MDRQHLHPEWYLEAVEEDFYHLRFFEFCMFQLFLQAIFLLTYPLIHLLFPIFQPYLLLTHQLPTAPALFYPFELFLLQNQDHAEQHRVSLLQLKHLSLLQFSPLTKDEQDHLLSVVAGDRLTAAGVLDIDVVGGLHSGVGVLPARLVHLGLSFRLRLF